MDDFKGRRLSMPASSPSSLPFAATAPPRRLSVPVHDERNIPVTEGKSPLMRLQDRISHDRVRSSTSPVLPVSTRPQKHGAEPTTTHAATTPSISAVAARFQALRRRSVDSTTVSMLSLIHPLEETFFSSTTSSEASTKMEHTISVHRSLIPSTSVQQPNSQLQHATTVTSRPNAVSPSLSVRSPPIEPRVMTLPRSGTIHDALTANGLDRLGLGRGSNMESSSIHTSDHQTYHYIDDNSITHDHKQIQHRKERMLQLIQSEQTSRLSHEETRIHTHHNHSTRRSSIVMSELPHLDSPVNLLPDKRDSADSLPGSIMSETNNSNNTLLQNLVHLSTRSLGDRRKKKEKKKKSFNTASINFGRLIIFLSLLCIAAFVFFGFQFYADIFKTVHTTVISTPDEWMATNVYSKVHSDGRSGVSRLTESLTPDSSNINYFAKATTDGFYYFAADGSWKKIFLHGVNMGVTKPGYDPAELSLSQDNYLRLFNYVIELNLQVIRIYTLLPPIFYSSLHRFNLNRQDKPLLIVQGVWTPDTTQLNSVLTLPSLEDFYNLFYYPFRNSTQQVFKAFHGDLIIDSTVGSTPSGSWDIDVSPYIIASVIGTEWDPDFVLRVNTLFSNSVPPYTGTYFYSSGASPFETVLAEILDFAAQIDMSYNGQRPMAICNWMQTDPLSHPDDPGSDLVSVDASHILASSSWKAGTFASFHVYPYYPEFMKYQYTSHADPFQAVLEDLVSYHAPVMAVMVTETGLPSSMANGHNGPLNRNQGNLGEATIGTSSVSMLNGMKSANISGAFLFSLMDEWFKSTWNTELIELPESRQNRWLNRLSPEQNFGLIAVEPINTLTIDGLSDDWDKFRQTEIHSESNKEIQISWKVTSDESFLYLLASNLKQDWTLLDSFSVSDALVFGFDFLSGGSQQIRLLPSIQFQTQPEFVIIIANGTAKSYIDSSLDFTLRYHVPQMEQLDEDLHGTGSSYSFDGSRIGSPDDGIFNLCQLPISNSIYIPSTNTIYKYEMQDIGDLKFGSSVSAAPDANLVNWFINGSTIELRVPWSMMGVSDPTSGQVISSLSGLGASTLITTDSASRTKVELIKTELGSLFTTGVNSNTMSTVAWLSELWPKTSTAPCFCERKKQSFSILKNYFNLSASTLNLPAQYAIDSGSEPNSVRLSSDDPEAYCSCPHYSIDSYEEYKLGFLITAPIVGCLLSFALAYGMLLNKNHQRHRKRVFAEHRRRWSIHSIDSQKIRDLEHGLGLPISDASTPSLLCAKRNSISQSPLSAVSPSESQNASRAGSPLIQLNIDSTPTIRCSNYVSDSLSHGPSMVPRRSLLARLGYDDSHASSPTSQDLPEPMPEENLSVPSEVAEVDSYCERQTTDNGSHNGDDIVNGSDNGGEEEQTYYEIEEEDVSKDTADDFVN
eukprot:GILJ01007047.1.p1 GENE.GILJ01007047.1~~GILJ01007047.1.p1  ORF type:complete len:1408 (+),score=206.82 GILJ01007047.1:33-4256(+)